MHSDQVRELVHEYCARYRMEPCVVRDLATPAEMWGGGNVKNDPGCYAIYGESRQLRYIGASQNIRRRSCSHFARAVQACEFWRGGVAKFVQLIETIEPWECWSLEIFLTIKTKHLREEGASRQGA